MLNVSQDIQMMPTNLFRLLIAIGILVIASDIQVYSSTLKNLSERESTPESCHLRELELCTLGLVSIFQNPNGLPMSQAEFKRQCDYFNESIQCFDSYADNCMTQDQFGIVNLFTQNSIQLVKDFCQPDSELRTNYTKHVECFREVQRKFQKPCMTDFQIGFEGIHKMTNRSTRLTTACCNMNRLKECFFGPIDYECGLSASETVEKLLMTIFGTLFTLPCRAFDSGNPECQQLLPKTGLKPHTGRNTSALSRVISSFTGVPAQL